MIWKLECTLFLRPSKGCCVIFVVVGYIPWSTHSSFKVLRLQPCQGSPPVRGLCLSHWFSSMENKAWKMERNEWMIDIWHIHVIYKLFIFNRHQALNHTLYTNESWIYNIVLPKEKNIHLWQKITGNLFMMMPMVQWCTGREKNTGSEAVSVSMSIWFHMVQWSKLK